MIPALLVAAGVATAAPAKPTVDDVHVDLLAGTTLPLDVRGRLQVEVPHRLRVGVHGGWMPPAYVDLVNEIGTSAGWYDETTAELIAAALESAGLFGVDVGWRPFPKAGFAFGVGWQLAALGGGVTGTEVLSATTGVPLGLDARREVPVDALVNMVTVDLTYEHVFVEHVVLRVDLGGAFTVDSRSHVEGPSGRSTPLTQAGEDYLDTTMETYVHTPTIGVALGYRFR